MRAKPFPASRALVAGFHEVGGEQSTTDSEVRAEWSLHLVAPPLWAWSRQDTSPREGRGQGGEVPAPPPEGARSSAASLASFTGARVEATAVGDLKPSCSCAATANSLRTGEIRGRDRSCSASPLLSLTFPAILALLSRPLDVPSQLLLSSLFSVKTHGSACRQDPFLSALTPGPQLFQSQIFLCRLGFFLGSASSTKTILISACFLS